MAELIITEKPSTSLKIAEALAPNKFVKKVYNKKISYYELERDGKKIFIVCAVGHLYTVAEKDKKGWVYPVFDVEWKPSFEVSKDSAFTKNYLDAIKKLTKEADSFVVACDWDVEGEVIGYNILHFVCKQEDAKRMHYSTTTKIDLLRSYENVALHIDRGLAESGIARHILDFYWGINTSRALTLAVKNATKMFKILSSGRVQGPALKILADREIEITNFKPTPFWQIELITNKINAWHWADKFWDKKEAEQILKKTKGKEAKVTSLKKTQFEQMPPPPFDLTTLQTEAFKHIGLSPKQTLAAAQELYLSSLISYPRTSSNQYPETIDFKKILEELKKQPEYKELAEKLLTKKTLKPNNGEKKDPAHPAIYITGEQTTTLTGDQKKLYDLITKRFLATFSEPATRETVDLQIGVNGETFVNKGTRTIKKGWHDFYSPYAKFEEEELPKMEQGETLQNKDVMSYDKETSPPKRYNQSSLVKELEKRSLGTKCLTEDSLIRVSSDTPKHISIKDLFEEAELFGEQDGVLFAKNKMHHCFSITASLEKVPSFYSLVSKRKLMPNEQVSQINFLDGTKVKLTEDHPVLVYNSGSIYYKPAREIINGDKIVSSFNDEDKIGKVIVGWEDFLKLTKNERLILGKFDVKKLRNQLNLSQAKFGQIIGIGQCGIWKYEHSNALPLKFWDKLGLGRPKYLYCPGPKLFIMNPFPLKLSSPLARILANLVGDGSIDKEKIKRENCYDFRYSNTDLQLIKRFIFDINKVFGIHLNYKIAKKQDKHKIKYYTK
ncbi:DNA topoisomerase I, partial [Candidatus Woesearchaeota archaeon]|nr:DNA topoisomerase I [Candidatus Woesearchaeota archaeon]